MIVWTIIGTENDSERRRYVCLYAYTNILPILFIYITT